MHLLMIFSAAGLLVAAAQTNLTLSTSTTNQTAALRSRPARRGMRAACINGRRCICGKVIKIVPEGLVVESGYTALMHPPFTGSWVIPSGALVNRDSKLIERSEPASPCIGTVLLTDFPKRPTVKLYDYVLLQGTQPANTFTLPFRVFRSRFGNLPGDSAPPLR